MHWRCRWLSLPYGDQAVFTTRSAFERIGGFPTQPIMEDIEMVRRLRRIGRVRVCDSPAITSARRWRHGGWMHVAAFNQFAIVAYLLGVSPARLAAWRP